MTEDGPSPHRSFYVASPQRFVSLALFAAICFSYAGAWLTLAPVTDVAMQRFDVGPGAVNAFGISYMAMYFPGTLLQLWLVDSSGVRSCLVLSSLVLSLSLLVRWVALLLPLSPHGAYALSLAAQYASAVTQPLPLNLAARLAGDWFPAAERDLATTAAAMSNVVGQAVFSLAVPWAVAGEASNLPNVFLLQLLFSGATTVLAYCLLRERPVASPSAAAALQLERRPSKGGDKEQASLWFVVYEVMADLRVLLANSNFLFLALGFSVGVGTGWALLVLEQQLITPCGYSDNLAGSAGAALLIAGIIAAFASGYYLESSRAYLEMQRAVVGLTFCASLCVLLTVQPGMPVRLLLAWCFLGCCLQPLNPLTLEHGAEMTFPISPDVSTATLYLIANVFAMLLSIGLTPLLQTPAALACSTVFSPTACVITALMAVGLGLTLAVRRDYRRSVAERSARGGEEEALTMRAGEEDRLLGGERPRPSNGSFD